MTRPDRLRDLGDRLACALVCIAAAVGLALICTWIWRMPVFG